MNIDTLICSKWIIPVEPDDTILEDYAIAINDGVILELLPITDALAKYQPFEITHLEEHALIPGLINSHTHAAMSLFRGLADDLPLMEWLNEHIWPAEQRWISPQFVEDGTRLAIAEMLRGGTTCFNDMYFFPDTAANVALEAGIRAVIGLIMIDFPTAWAKDAQEYLDKGEHVHDRFRHSPLIRTAFAPHAPYTVSDAPLQRIATIAEELDIPIHMHIHETDHEINESIDQHGKRPLQRLDELGLVSNRLLAVHMTHLVDEDIERVVRYGVHVVHCPESNLKLGSGFCPVQQLLNSGVNVALGTDGAASNNDLDMLGEMRSAAILAKGITADSSSVPAHTALRMATLNGARALGLESVTGSLLPGKEADVVAINLGELETQPVYDPISQIVYACSRNQVSDVWVAGKQLLKSRQLLTISEEQVKQATRQWQLKLREYRDNG